MGSGLLINKYANLLFDPLGRDNSAILAAGEKGLFDFWLDPDL